MKTHPCTLCPRQCAVDRSQTRGFCGASQQMEVAAVCVHRGEEPPLNPIVNVFFAHCNLQCIYCQNWQISGSASADHAFATEDEESLATRIAALLPQGGGTVGFVTAAHYADHLPNVVEALHRKGYFPTVVYNSSGYEAIDSLRQLEGTVDIYLPDLKYMDPALAQAYSHAPDYPQVATAAIAEMARQVGQSLKIDPDNGRAHRGLLVRHLVLPHSVANSLQCLEWLATHFVPWRLHLSLMAQYYPPHPNLPFPLNQPLAVADYEAVKSQAEALGFQCGWIQSIEANASYRPDFGSSSNPFESRTSN